MMLAVGFHCWPCSCPDEVRPADACIPKVAQACGDVLAHFIQDAVVPAGAGRLWAFLADEPDGGRKGGRGQCASTIAHLGLNGPASVYHKPCADDCRDERFP